LQDTRTGQKAN